MQIRVNKIYCSNLQDSFNTRLQNLNVNNKQKISFFCISPHLHKEAYLIFFTYGVGVKKILRCKKNTIKGKPSLKKFHKIVIGDPLSI